VIEIHFKDFVFGVKNLGSDSQDSLFDFAGDGALGSQECDFDKLLSNGTSTLETLPSYSFPGSPQDSAGVKSMMLIKVAVFDCNRCLCDKAGEIRQTNGCTVLVVIDFI